MVPREQEQLRMLELMEVGRFERRVLGEETALESTVHLVLSASDVVDTMTRSNFFTFRQFLSAQVFYFRHIVFYRFGGDVSHGRRKVIFVLRDHVFSDVKFCLRFYESTCFLCLPFPTLLSLSCSSSCPAR